MTVPLEWRASITGTQQVISELQSLRQQYNSGTIGLQEYTQKSRYLNSALRQSTNGFNQQRQILLASHPALQTYTRAMSVFGHVASTALSVMNALNIASLNNNTASQGLRAAELELIDARKELIRLEEAGLGGTIQWELQKQKVEELTKAVEDQKKAVAEAATQNQRTMITAWINIGTSVGSEIVSSIAMIKLMQAQGIFTANALRIAFSTVFLPVMIGLAAFLAGWYVAARLVETLFPEAFKKMQASIKESWGIDDPTGMLATATGAYLGFVAMFNDLKIATADTVKFIYDAFRVLIKNLSFGFINLPPLKITGLEETRDVVSKEKQRIGLGGEGWMNDPVYNGKYNEKGEWIGGNESSNKTPASATPPAPTIGQTSLGLEIPGLDEINKKRDEELLALNSQIATQREEMEQEQKRLDVERDALIAQRDAKRALDSTDQDIIILDSTISDLDTKIDILGDQLAEGIDVNISDINVNNAGGSAGANPGNPYYRNYPGYQSGMPDYDVAAATGYEGMVTSPTKFLVGEKGPEYVSVTPNKKSTNDMFKDTQLYKGMMQKGEENRTLPMIHAKNGYEGIVNSPTRFLAGESRSEMVKITPLGSMTKNNSNTTIIQNIYVQGSILAEREVERISDRALKRDLKRVGF